MDINWSEDTFSTTHLSENVNFPQLVRISATITSSFNKTYGGTAATKPGVSSGLKISVGDVLKVHGVKSFKRIIATGVTLSTGKELVAHEYGYLSAPGNTSVCRQISIPINFSMPLQIVPYRDSSFVYQTVGDLVKEIPRPNSVVVNKRIILPEKHCTIKEGDIIAITGMDKRCTSLGVVDYLICKHNDKTIGLPMSCIGNFTAHCEETKYLLSDLIKKCIDLPQKVCFIKPEPTPTPYNNKTLARDGEHYILPGQPYILERAIKREYLICTKCDHSYGHCGDMSSSSILFIPTDSEYAQKLFYNLPLFHDLMEYEQIVNSKCCPTLSIRNIADCTPIELVGDQRVVVKSMSEIYDTFSPLLPPRKDIPEQVDGASSGSTQWPSQKKLPYKERRLHSSEANLADMLHSEEKTPRENHRNRKHCCGQVSTEEQPLLAELELSPGSHKHPIHGAISKNRKGFSTPSTPESCRRRNDPQTWTEKVFMSLDNLKKAFRKGGSAEKERSKIGDGSELADSFENLSVYSQPPNMPCSDSDQPSADYENFKLVTHPTPGDSKPHSKNSPSAISLSKCDQIKEKLMWTPPCSPDYRDHTTAMKFYNSPIAAVSNTHHFPQNDPEYDAVDLKKPPDIRLTSSTSHQASLYTDHPHYLNCSNINKRYSSDLNIHPSQANHKSPKPAPRRTKDPHDMSFATTDACSSYENISSVLQQCRTDKVPASSHHQSSELSGYRDSSKPDLFVAQVEHIKSNSVEVIHDDLTQMTVAGLCDSLQLYGLPRVALKFRQHQIDGQFFNIMSDFMFKDENFDFSDFEILKLKKLREGWRPRL